MTTEIRETDTMNSVASYECLWIRTTRDYTYI